MKEVFGQDERVSSPANSKRRRVWRRVGRVFTLAAASFYVLLFLLVLQTGYLSRIGVLLGILYVTPSIASPIAGIAGRRRLEAFLSWLNTGIPIITALVIGLAIVWPEPEGNGAWSPYRFDDELAAIEFKRAIPDAENAARRYDSVFGGMDEADEPDFIFSGVTVRDELGTRPWKGDDYPQASQWLDSQAGLIDKLLEVGRTEKCRWPVQADTYDEYTVPYGKLNHSVKLLLAAGNRDLGEGRVAEALTKYFCILRIADHLHQQPSMVDSLTAFGRERFVLQMIRYVLVQSNPSDQNIAEVASRLPMAADPWPQEWARLLEFEKLRYMNLLGRLYEVNDEGAVRFVTDPVISPKDQQGQENAKRMVKFPRLYWLMSMPRDPNGVHPLVDRYFATLDPIVRSERLPRVDRSEHASHASLKETIKAACNFFRWFWEMASFNEREYIHHRQFCAPAITARRGTWLVLGLRRYRDAHGAWPQTLDMIAEYVPAEAFFDPTTGGAFVYALDGNSFKLYSKGVNRIDDGGRQHYVKALDKLEDDISLWPPPPPPEPPDEESIRKELESIYGKDYVEAHFRDNGSDKR